MNIKVIQNKNAQEFLKMNEKSLKKNTSINNLLLGIPTQEINGQQNNKDAIYLTALEDEKIIGQAMSSDEDRNLLCLLCLLEAPIKISETFFKLRPKFRGVYGERKVCEPISKNLSKVTGKNLKLVEHHGIYELNTLIMPETNNLNLIHQDDVDPDLLLQWTVNFIKECNLHPQMDSLLLAKKYLETHEKIKGFRFIKNEMNEIVSMAAKHREFEDYATISMVYTPIEHRRYGHGKRVTALLVKELLEGKYNFCNLFTEMKNPTSNRIYQEIGFEILGEVVSFEFVDENKKLLLSFIL